MPEKIQYLSPRSDILDLTLEEHITTLSPGFTGMDSEEEIWIF